MCTSLPGMSPVLSTSPLRVSSVAMVMAPVLWIMRDLQGLCMFAFVSGAYEGGLAATLSCEGQDSSMSCEQLKAPVVDATGVLTHVLACRLVDDNNNAIGEALATT